MLYPAMRIIARNTLVNFWSKHPDAKVALERWYKLVRPAHWASTDEVQRAAPKSKVPVRSVVKFIGTHPEYDRVDVLSISQY